MMSSKNKHLVIKVNPEDNVGIITDSQGLNKGSILQDGTILTQHIPMGHKVALSDIVIGGEIKRYGEIIGNARKVIKRGDWIDESEITEPKPPDLNTISFSNLKKKKIKSLDGYTFEGYKNHDGSVGTKNILGITTSVQCVAGLTQHVAKKIKQELLPKYTNVDDVVALNHTYGCGVAIDAPSAIIPIRNNSKHCK